MNLTLTQLREFAVRYTAAWCSHNAASVAALYSPNGSLSINEAAPSVGRGAIEVAVQEFMTAFPDLQLFLEDISISGERVVYRRTLTGTNTNPWGTEHHVRISGFETWRMSDDGLIAESQGHFDRDDFARQMQGGPSS